MNIKKNQTGIPSEGGEVNLRNPAKNKPFTYGLRHPFGWAVRQKTRVKTYNVMDCAVNETFINFDHTKS